jgi:tRNA threonylcarbamoyladenosine biosynthesis protein TsaB
MALILNIDTAVEAASVCLAKDGEVLSFLKNEKQKDHASWLHIAIK